MELLKKMDEMRVLILCTVVEVPSFIQNELFVVPFIPDRA